VKDKAMLYAKTQCAKVEGGAVTATGTFAELIAPASTFREGFPVERAKTEFGVYKIQPIPSVTAGQTREVVSPTIAQMTTRYIMRLPETAPHPKSNKRKIS
jgi:hypothetical protein